MASSVGLATTFVVALVAVSAVELIGASAFAWTELSAAIDLVAGLTLTAVTLKAV